MQKIKDKIVKNIKKIIKLIIKFIVTTILPYIIIPIIIIVLLGAIVHYLKEKDGTYDEGNDANTGYAVQSQVFDEIDKQDIIETDTGYRINIDLDAKVEEIIKQLEMNNGSLNKYLSKKNRNEYLKAFIKAELVTQYPDLRDEQHIGTKIDDGEFQGIIKVKRKNKDEKESTLTYLDYETFEQYVTSNNYSSIKNRFTLDSSGNLVVAGWTKTTTKTTSNVPGIEAKDDNQYTVVEKNINYKAMLDRYTMPFDFIWAFLVMGQDEDMAYEIAQLALKSEITITAFDNYTETKTTETTEYEEEETRNIEVEISNKKDNNVETYTAQDEPEKVNCNYKTVKTTTIEDLGVTIDIDYADAWIAKYSNEYIKSQNQTKDNNTTDIENADWINVKDKDISVSKAEKDEKFKQLKEKIIAENSEANNNATIKKAHLLDKVREIKCTMEINTSVTRYDKGISNVEEKTNANSEVPNFVTILNDHQKAKGSIVSAPRWLYEMLEGSEKTADMVDLVRYLLYKATGSDFGKETFDFSIFDLSKFVSLSGGQESGIIGWDFTCLHENGNMWFFRHGIDKADYNSLYVKGYISEDQSVYYCKGDTTSNGSKNYGYGVCVYTKEYGVMQQTYFKNYGIDIAATIGQEQPTETVDNISKEIWMDKREEVVRTIESLGYSEGDFEDYQIDCLADIRYQGYSVSGIITKCKQIGICEELFNSYKCFYNSGVRGKDRWKLFSEGKYLLSDSRGNTLYELDKNSYAIEGAIIAADMNTDGYTQKITINGIQYTEYKQNSNKWANHSYWGSDMINSGCGPTSIAVVLSGFKKYENEYPTKVADGMNYTGSGTIASRLNSYGISNEIEYSPTQSSLTSFLSSGNPVIVSFTKAYPSDGGLRFTSGSHISAILGISGSNVYVSNVYNSTNLRTGWVPVSAVMDACEYIVKIKSKPDNIIQ